MAGDTVMMNAYAWYQSPVQPPPADQQSPLDDLLDAVTGGVIGSGGKYNGSQSTEISDALSPSVLQLLNENDSTYNSNTTRAQGVSELDSLCAVQVCRRSLRCPG